MPVILIGVFWYLTKLLSVKDYLRPAIATTGGQYLWLVVGLGIIATQGKITDDQMLSLLGDVPIGFILLGWALWKQSRASVIGLMVYQAFALGIHVLNLEGAAQGQVSYLLMHILLRLIELGCGIYALAKMRKVVSEAY